MKILELLKEINEKSSRKGMFTTGIMSLVEGRTIALFFTGSKHAGENMTDLLKQRQAELDPPIQMCDALSRNTSREFKTILANCLVHGRRNFVDVAENFPEETAHVIDQIALVYRNDETVKEQNLSPQERLLFHQRESAPVMKNLKQWFSQQIEQKKTEPNSGLGKAIAYMLKHWDPLTLFLRVPGAPLDNNICYAASGITDVMPTDGLCRVDVSDQRGVRGIPDFQYMVGRHNQRLSRKVSKGSEGK
jgi:hypothetical protein